MIVVVVLSCTSSQSSNSLKTDGSVNALAGRIGRWPADVSEVLIPSSYDQTLQPSLYWAPSNHNGPRPVLVVLHGWSDDYLQESSIDYWQWCREIGWVYIQPNFRGPNNNAEALGSEAAISDIIDAVEFVCRQNQVDSSNVYLIASSGNGHIALLAASRQPELWKSILVWSPVYDLERLYRDCDDSENAALLKEQMRKACGGQPGKNKEVDFQYRLRSPSIVLKDAAGVPVEICSAFVDSVSEIPVPVSHSLMAFNALAKAEGQAGMKFTDEQISYMDRNQRLPSELIEEMSAGPCLSNNNILFQREVGNCRITIFRNGGNSDRQFIMRWLGYDLFAVR